MPKHKIINLYGVDIKIKDKSITTRKKITTQIDIKNYEFIKDIHTQSNIEMSILYDNLIYLVRNNPSILKQYLNMVKNY